MASTGETWRLGHRPALDGLRSIAMLLVVLAAAGVGVWLNGAVAAHYAAANDRAACAFGRAESAARARIVTGHGRDVWVLGDSYAAGFGLANQADSWPRWLRGRVHVEAFGGTGYATTRCGVGADYGHRAARVLAAHPDVVVIQGGLNDVYSDPTVVRRRAERLAQRFAATGARVVLVGPTMAPARGGRVLPIDHSLAAAARAAGVQYVRATGWPLPYLPDKIHLTRAGHREFGRRVALAMRLGQRPVFQ